MIIQKPYTTQQYAELAIYANDNKLVISDNGDYLETEAKYTDEELALQEAERIANLEMTRRDFFRGIYNALGDDYNRTNLRAMISNAELDGFTESDKELALIDFDEGNEFNRGNELVELLCANSTITSDQMTAFFETGDYNELIEELKSDEN